MSAEVYLEELAVMRTWNSIFQDGMVTDYTCSNFEDEEENRKYVRENVLFHHDTLRYGRICYWNQYYCLCSWQKNTGLRISCRF